MYLSRFGHAVQAVESGQAALTTLFAESADVVVLDLLMPEMDGAKVLEVIRSYYRFHHMPVIVWTGAGKSSVLHQAQDLHPAAVLLKPQDSFPQVLAAVEQAVH